MAIASKPTLARARAHRAERFQRHPSGWLRHYAGLLSPDAAAGIPLTLERDRAKRARRLLQAVADGVRQRSRPTRGRMRALQVSAGGRLRFTDEPAPPLPGPYGAIVHPIAASTCDLDCPITLGRTLFALPLHLGHECVADVLAVGDRVMSVKPGDRVVVPFQINCGICAACRSGRTGSCTSVPPVSMYGMGLLAGHWGGAFSDELAVPYADAMLVPLPEGLNPVAAASAADNICDAYRHIAPHLPRLLAEDPDAEVLILAALSPRFEFSASVPLYTGLIARAYGARNVCLVDARLPVREQAERLGVEALHPRMLRRRAPARLVVDVSVDRLPLALSKTAADGICSSGGSFHRGARVPTLAMYVRNVSVHVGRTHARALIPDVLVLMQSRRLDAEPVITTVASIDDAPAVLREHCSKGGVKTVLTA
jgi:alcohol dehydrogenase